MDRVLFPEVLTNSLKLKLMFRAVDHAAGSSSADGVCSSSWDIKRSYFSFSEHFIYFSMLVCRLRFKVQF